MRTPVHAPSRSPAVAIVRPFLSLGGAVVASLLLALPASASDFQPGEAAQVELANHTANRAHPAGTPLSSDPDGVWDCDNFAFMKYRILRDVLDWPVERLALAWAQRGGEARMIVLVHGQENWAVLDYLSDEVGTLAAWEQAGWRIDTLPYEPAASPSAPWVMRVRDTLADIHPPRPRGAAD